MNANLATQVPAVVLMAGGLYLTVTAIEKTQGRWRRGVGVVMLIAGLLLPFLPSGPGVVWEKYQPGMLEAAAQKGEPVILDFFATWCGPCHELEQFTYSDPQVAEASQAFRKIQVDATDLEVPEVARLLERYQVDGVPTVLFLDGRGVEITEARIMGFVTPKEFLAIVRSPKVQAALQKKP